MVLKKNMSTTNHMFILQSWAVNVIYRLSFFPRRCQVVHGALRRLVKTQFFDCSFLSKFKKNSKSGCKTAREAICWARQLPSVTTLRRAKQKVSIFPVLDNNILQNLTTKRVFCAPMRRDLCYRFDEMTIKEHTISKRTMLSGWRTLLVKDRAMLHIMPKYSRFVDC